MGNKNTKKENDENNNDVKNYIVSKQDIEYFNDHIQKLKSLNDELKNLLIVVNYISDNNGVIEVTKDNFLKRLVLVHTDTLTGINKELFGKSTYKFGITYNDESKIITTGKNGKIITQNVKDVINHYQDEVIKYFDTKLEIYKKVDEFIKDKKIGYFEKILQNSNTMVEGVSSSLYSADKRHIRNAISDLEIYFYKLIKYVETSLKPKTNEVTEKLFSDIENVIEKLQVMLCKYEKELKYFLWECEGDNCEYIAGKNENNEKITYHGLPKINAAIIKKIPDFTC